MSSKMWTVSLLLFVGLACVACVDSGCPEGSHEVEGMCMELTGNDGGESRSGVEGKGGAGGSGSKPQAGSGGTASADPRDAGGDAADAGDGATPGVSDASDQDAAPPAVACADVTCGSNARCDESTGTSTCVCVEGFAGDGQTCTNIDECAAGTASCGANAECTDEPGTYSCACKPGYEGDGQSCAANPCEPRVDPCDAQTATCRAAGGKAVCDCVEGRDRCDGDLYACRTDVRSDPDHCGACAVACAGNLACASSACEQPSKALALGYEHSCAIDRNDRVLCWGDDRFEQLQRTGSSSVFTFEPEPAALGGPATLLSAGSYFNVALLANDDLLWWGGNPIGTVDPPMQGFFTLAMGQDTTSRIASGTAASCSLVSGSVYCWGRSLAGELGNATSTEITFAQANKITLGPPALEVSVGNGQACALGNDHRLRCWGNGDPAPREVLDAGGAMLSDVRAIASGDSSSSGCAVLANGHVLCWGDNSRGQLGNPSVVAARSENAVTVLDGAGTPLTGAVDVKVGSWHACARRQDGTVACWGQRNRLGAGTSGTAPQRSYVEVPAIRDALELAVGDMHTCVRRRTGQVQCWGENAKGQLGVNPQQTPLALEPVSVLGLP